MNPSINIADTDEKILKCRQVLLDLRPHINKDDFLFTINKMIIAGYTMIYVEVDGEAVSVAGFFTGYKLHRGKYLYIDDLNTLSNFRQKGYGSMLMDWIINYARNNSIEQVHLDSGVQRFDAHKFYLNKGFNITSHHFALKFPE